MSASRIQSQLLSIVLPFLTNGLVIIVQCIALLFNQTVSLSLSHLPSLFTGNSRAIPIAVARDRVCFIHQRQWWRQEGSLCDHRIMAAAAKELKWIQVGKGNHDKESCCGRKIERERERERRESERGFQRRISRGNSEIACKSSVSLSLTACERVSSSRTQ